MQGRHLISGQDTDAGKLLLRQHAVGSQQLDALQDGYGIVQCAERIDAYVKSEVSELPADVV